MGNRTINTHFAERVKQRKRWTRKKNRCKQIKIDETNQRMLECMIIEWLSADLPYSENMRENRSVNPSISIELIVDSSLVHGIKISDCVSRALAWSTVTDQ